MRARIFLSSVLVMSVASVSACSTSSPKSYARAGLKEGCKYIEECDEATWNQAGYDSVNDCRDDLESMLDEFTEGGSYADEFADQCQDYDRSSARKCLKALRDIRKECGSLDVENADCNAVCGPPETNTETDTGADDIDRSESMRMALVLDHLERTGYLDLGMDEDEEVLSSEP